MIVVDTSVLVEVLTRAPDWPYWIEQVEALDGLLISSANVLELGIVLAGRQQGFVVDDALEPLERWSITVADVGLDQAAIAIEAARRYGKGRHPARLNFGDCFAYALARSRSAPLLFKGEDFSLTDIIVHPASRP